jgi:hypothetical protein
MDPRVWGPHGWFFIETVILSIPENTTDTGPYIRFLQSLADVLPCPGCQGEYREYLTTHPIPTSREDLIAWIFTFHNAVRERTGKAPRSIESSIAYYKSQFTASGSSRTWIWVLVILLIIGLGVYQLKK